MLRGLLRKGVTAAVAIAVAILVAAPSYAPLAAQAPSIATRIEASLGLARGGGGTNVRDQRLGHATGLSVLHRWRETPATRHWFGVSARAFSVVDNRDDCQGVSGGECFARYPEFRSVAVRAGVEIGGAQDSRSVVRLLGGLSYVRVDGAGSAGVEASLGLPFARFGATEIGLVLDGSVVPRWNGATWWWGSAGIALALGW